jgi:hypothetical protein
VVLFSDGADGDHAGDERRQTGEDERRHDGQHGAVEPALLGKLEQEKAIALRFAKAIFTSGDRGFTFLTRLSSRSRFTLGRPFCTKFLDDFKKDTTRP